MQTNINEPSQPLLLLLNLFKAQTVINRKFDGKVSAHGLGANDFIILHHLVNAEGRKLRRIDLAELVGVTASGVTRMLAPMEKIGLVTRERNERDARISYVILAPGGKRVYEDALVTANHFAETLLPGTSASKAEKLSELLAMIGG